jgi:hypothetical protein
VAETNGLLNRRTGKSGTEGSNPSVSATSGTFTTSCELERALKNSGFPYIIRFCQFAADCRKSRQAATKLMADIMA